MSLLPLALSVRAQSQAGMNWNASASQSEVETIVENNCYPSGQVPGETWCQVARLIWSVGLEVGGAATRAMA